MTPPNNTNEDLAIKDEALRYIWAGWFIFVILTTLIGDTTILIASITYKAIKLPEVLVAFIQHIAVTDLAISLTSLSLHSVSLITNKWVFGATLCYIRPYVSSTAYQAGSLFVCGMTVCKLLTLKFPLRSFTWTAGQAHKVCGMIWIFALTTPIGYFTIGKNDVSFDYRSYTCTYEFNSHLWKFLQPADFVIFYMIPAITVLVTAVMILAVARRVAKEGRRGVKWQGAMTVVLTATVYSISILPTSVYHIAEPFVEKEASEFGPFKITYYRVAASFLTINVISNLYIYCLTVTSFRDFLRTRTQRITSWFLNTFKIQGGLLFLS